MAIIAIISDCPIYGQKAGGLLTFALASSRTSVTVQGRNIPRREHGTTEVGSCRGGLSVQPSVSFVQNLEVTLSCCASMTFAAERDQVLLGIVTRVAGDAKHAVRCPILRSTTRSSAGGEAMLRHWAARARISMRAPATTPQRRTGSASRECVAHPMRQHPNAQRKLLGNMPGARFQSEYKE